MRSSFLFSFRIQILCFLLALKGITSGMIWDAATSAKGQMSIGREDLVVLPPGSPTKKLSCAPRCKAARLQGWEALMQHVYEPYKRGLRALRNFLLLFNNESATVFPQFSSTKSSITQCLKIAKKGQKSQKFKKCDIFDDFQTLCFISTNAFFLKRFSFLLFRSSGQINSLHYHDDTSEKEFICSAEDSSGMHKCNKLPPFDDENGIACHAR